MRLQALRLLVAGFLILPGICRADYLDDVGFSALQLELGSSSPDGTGVTIAQVEADNDSSSTIAYMPDTSDLSFGSVTISNATTSSTYTSSSISGHATMVGKLIYGADSMANGVTSVSVYNVSDWIYNRMDYGTGNIEHEYIDVVNHSWVGDFYLADGVTINTTAEEQLLRRLDYSVNLDDYVAVVGVNNGSSQKNLLSSAYNVISVGVSSGNHDSSLSSVNGNGRVRVHLVVPTSTTSEATAVVSSASALLIETARGMGSTNGAKSETIKAVLLAGATKNGLSGWSHTTTNPLDDTYGAGQLNIQNSYHILTAGEQNTGSGTLLISTGWDYDTVSSSSSKTYYLQLTDASSLSIALTWNVAVSGSLTNTLYDLNLQLYSTDGFTMDTLLDQSISDVDNVEYIWQQDLSAGTYAIVVSSENSSTWDYSLAWLSSELSASTVPEPGTWTMLLGGLAMLAGLQTYRRHSNS